MRAKPPAAGMGRQKGSKNKLPRETRAYVLAVVDQLESEGLGLLEWSRKNPNDFWGKIFKALIPRDLKIESDSLTNLADAIREGRKRVESRNGQKTDRQDASRIDDLDPTHSSIPYQKARFGDLSDD